MGKTSIIICLFFACVSCINHQEKSEDVNSNFWPTLNVDELDEQNLSLKTKYAKGFQIKQVLNEGIMIETFSIEGNESWNDHMFLPQSKSDFSAKFKTLAYPINKVACQSSTYLAFLSEMGKGDRVVGLCGMQYVQNEWLKQELENNNTQEICLGESTQVETILNIDPDLYLVYPFEADEIDHLEEKGVKTLMIAEYLEQHPLARLEWIKVFGVLFDEIDYALNYFKTVEESYNANVRDEIEGDNRFFMNLPYGDSWHAPASASLIVNMCRDAGLAYYFNDDGGTENVPHSKEEMWELGTEIPYWIIIATRPAGFSLADLKAEEEVYSTFKSVKEGKVIFCNTAISDYFTFGLVEPNVMLQEIKDAIDGKEDHDPKYFKVLK